nr:GNAT family N-acetyltransferase [Bacillus alkalicellulosilyticus]
MTNQLKIEQLFSADRHYEQLSELLIRVVEDGASIGFLPPIKREDADKYWTQVIQPDTLLFVAKLNQQIVGSVQLQLCTKQNGNHRAEIAKLMTHPTYRRMGIGRMLMNKVEERAVEEDRSLIVLDTREGDPSNVLYASLGYVQAGKIPNYAKSSTGELHPTVFYYKLI